MSRFIRDHSHTNVGVYCLACGKHVWLHDAIVDIEGPAFKAYYHQGCVPKTTPEQEVPS